MEKDKTPMIQVKNLYKVYKVGNTKVYALNGVDFTIYKGEFCAIVGPSGSGKSTLLNMLAGLEKPTKGEIVIGKSHIEKLSENQLVSFRRKHGIYRSAPVPSLTLKTESGLFITG